MAKARIVAVGTLKTLKTLFSDHGWSFYLKY